MIDLRKAYKERRAGVYRLTALGTDVPVVLKFSDGLRQDGWRINELVEVCIFRTKYLNSIIPCQESENAISHLSGIASAVTRNLKVIDAGHVYQVDEVDPIRFIKRSGGAIQYDQEWPGLQTQEILRVLIDRMMLNRVHWDMADSCRKALWEYEARAYRRKRQQQNRKLPTHELTIFPYEWHDIEHQIVGEDGHIPYIESELLYYANYGGEDPIPGVDPIQIELDPVYQRRI